MTPSTRVSAQVPVIAALLRNGGVIAYPTEAVFGLGCDPADAMACERVIHLKGRSTAMGLIVITDDLERLAHWLEPVPEPLRARAEASWPGPHTWLWPARPECPPWLRGAHPRLAVRVTAHPAVRALCAAAGTALVSTSANRTGEPPARRAAEVLALFAGQIDGILDAPCAGAVQPSSIRDLISGRWVRGGPPEAPDPGEAPGKTSE